MTMTDTIEAVEAAPLGPGPEAAPHGRPYRMLLALVGVATSDGRIFDELTWRDLPLSLLWQPENEPGHDGAVIVGRIDRIVRDGAEVWGYGILDTVGDAGREVVRLIEGGFLKGVSVDAAVLDVEETDDGLLHFRAEVGAVTIVAFPAFRETQIELEDATDDTDTAPLAVAPALAASGALPPAAWFADPQASRREPLHVEADGRVWGHVYGWGECHTGSGPGQCIQAPPSRHAYAYFLTGRVLTDAGEIPTGPITIAANHAPLRASWLGAKDHYENTALAVADVTCGEDVHGIWVAGMVRPGTPDEQVHALRASCPSGDWRPIGGALELVAVLSVNMPGFPALAASYHGAELTALVASGVLPDEACSCGGGEVSASLAARLERMEAQFSAWHAATAAERARIVDEWAVSLGVDEASQLAEMDEAMGVSP